MAKNILAILIVLFLAAYSGISLLHPGLHPTHDGEYHIVRFYEFDKTLRDGNWYPRWAPDLNNGYGIPLFNYVYPLPNYAASLLHLFGFSFIDSFKLSLFLASIIGSIFFYNWSKLFWGRWGGVASAVLYLFSPYRFVDIFVRGSIGEIWALALLPALLWSVTKFIREKSNAYIILSGLFLSLIIFSHNILALMFFIFSLFYIGFLIYQEKNKKYLILNTFYIILLGLGLSAIFWLPALLEKQYVVGLQIYDIENNFPEIFQLLFPSWGTGFSNGSMSNQMSQQIGVANLLVVFLSILRLFIGNKKNRNLLIFFLFSFFLVFLLMTKSSLFIWETVPFMDYFQFPWRFLSLIIVIVPFLGGSLVHFIRPKILIILICLLSIFLARDYGKVAYYHNRDDNYYITRSNFIDSTNSPGNFFNTIWFDSGLKKENEKLKIKEGKIMMSPLFLSSEKYLYKLDVKEEGKLVFNTAYFPGWSVQIDNKETKITQEKGLISFTVPKGPHSVKIELAKTPVRNMASALSLLSVILIVLLLIRTKKLYVNQCLEKIADIKNKQ
ncbi:hypothetical protein C4577_06140 [Candidatus Parcubacteria bacterium]|nr:MAG: hypothetical protein C4577_06140 [Candidatus Parcubacteria bacterium]